MLTADLIKPRLRIRGSTLTVEEIDINHQHWIKTASELIDLFKAHVGKTHGEWQAALENYEGDRTDYTVIRGLAKVLSDAATFNSVETAIAPIELRERVFSYGPAVVQPDLFNTKTRNDIFDQVAKEIGLAAEQIDQALFADRLEAHILEKVGIDWTPTDLLARYNVELARGVLYWASELSGDIHSNYKDVWRYLKLFKLMFEAKPIENGYSLYLDGPISPFVSSTTRYGRQFAAFLPALFLCDEWKMDATVKLPHSSGDLNYHLDHKSSLRSHFKHSGEFDSRLEADFAAEFEEKFGQERGQWLLTREDEVLLLGDTVMIPDFAVTHKKDGRRALIEIVGFWHPDYLRRKVEKVLAAKRRNLILVVYEGVNLAAERLQGSPSEVLYFKNKPVLKDIMAAIERVAE